MTPAPASPTTPARPGLRPLVVFGLIFLGLRLLLIGLFGNATPYGDQWPGEAVRLYKPWLAGHLQASALFAPFNEHRIFTTRLLDLLLFQLNHQVWMPLLQMAAGAIIGTLALALLISLLARQCPPRQRLPFYGFALVSLITPWGWDNLLWGFQSQIYFLVLFSLLYIHGMATQEPASRRWWLALFCGVLSALSMASGLVTLLSGAAILLLRWQAAGRRGAARPVLALLIAAGAVAMTPAMPRGGGHGVYMAHSPAEFFAACNVLLSWPFLPPVCAAIVYLPALRFLLRFLRRLPEPRDASWLLAGLIVWVLGQLATIAYARAGVAFISRYQDITIVGLPLNFLCLLRDMDAAKGLAARLWSYFSLVWLAVVLLGFLLALNDLADGVAEKHRFGQGEERTLRHYLSAADGKPLSGHFDSELPYYYPGELQGYLDDPVIRHFLPANIAPENASRQAGWVVALTGRLDAVGAALLALGAGLALLQWRRRA